MTAKAIGSQVKGLLDQSAERLSGLTSKGRQVKDQVASRGRQALSEGQKALEAGRQILEERRQRVAQAFSGLHLKGLLDQYGKLPLPELMERLRAPELARPLALLREEAVAFLRVATTDQVEAIEESLKELTVEVKELRIALRKVQSRAPASGKAASAASKK
ncbi:MAG TPA: hypothetical protein PLQ97_14575 [Myxococcota bacterium]|nr:hypothetical protein [Myxococcota bacterium]HQK51936.1 hypothetical protein [Myxococcota bacterium]